MGRLAQRVTDARVLKVARAFLNAGVLENGLVSATEEGTPQGGPLEASRGATRAASAPVVLSDAGVENVNGEVDELIATGVLRRLLAFTELKFSNSMIEAWWRSLKIG
jgi:hypothetical protein